MLNIFYKVSKGIYYSLKYKSIQPLKFEYFKLRQLSNYDNYYLICRIKHEAHLLEKACKNEYVPERGTGRYIELKKLIKEAYSRNLNFENILLWAQNIVIKFESWSKSQKSSLTLGKIKKEEHELSVTSVRFWKKTIPQHSAIKRIVESAQYAPASCNRQAFKVCILENKNLKNKLIPGASNPSMFANAPYRVFLFINLSNYSEKYSHFIDVGMFAQNFLLQAKKEKLGTCPCYASEHIDSSQKFWRNYFKLSSEYYCALTILVGYPNEIAEKPPRVNVENIIQFEKK